MASGVGIAVWVSDVKQKLVTGLGENTSVQDVMMALNPFCNPATHGLYQIWRDTEEQLLRPRAKIVQILQAITEDDLPSIRFVLRKLQHNNSIHHCNQSVNTTRCSNNSSDIHNVPKQQSFRANTHNAPVKYPSSSDVLQRSRSSVDSVRPKHRSCSELNRSSAHDSSTSGVDRLIKLMREQDAKLSQQMKKIQQIEGEIEKIETEKHISRIEENGLDYILQGYLEDPEPVTKEDVDNIEKKLSKEQAKIQELSKQVSSSSSDSDILHEINQLRQEIQNSIQVSMDQEKEMSTMNKTLNDMHSDLEKKAKHIINLVEELDNDVLTDSTVQCEKTPQRRGIPDYEETPKLPGNSVNESNKELTQYSMLIQNRLGANTSMMDNILQRYRSNILRFEEDSDDSADSSDSGVSSQEAQSSGDQDSSLENTLISVTPPSTIEPNESIHLHDSTLPFSDRNSSLVLPSEACDSTHDTTLLPDSSLKPQQISIIGQNITIPYEQTLPNDTLQPLDILVTRQDVVASTPVPARPPTPPRRRVAFADHDSIREISMYSEQNTTILEEDEGVPSDNEVVDDKASDRFVVSVHQRNLPSTVAVENVSYQQAIYNYCPSDESHNNFLLAGPVSKFPRKLSSNKTPKIKGIKKQKILQKLMFLQRFSRKSKSSNCTTYEDTFEDSYRHAMMETPMTSSTLRNEDVTCNDVTLLRSYTISDVGKIGYSWIDDQLGKHHDSQLPTGWACNNPTGLETLV